MLAVTDVCRFSLAELHNCIWQYAKSRSAQDDGQTFPVVISKQAILLLNFWYLNDVQTRAVRLISARILYGFGGQDIHGEQVEETLIP